MTFSDILLLWIASGCVITFLDVLDIKSSDLSWWQQNCSRQGINKTTQLFIMFFALLLCVLMWPFGRISR